MGIKGESMKTEQEKKDISLVKQCSRLFNTKNNQETHKKITAWLLWLWVIVSIALIVKLWTQC